MKKIIVFIFLIIAVKLSAQVNPYDPVFGGITGVRLLQGDTVKADDAFWLMDDDFIATTKVSADDDTLATKAYVDAGGAAGVTVLDFDPLTGIAAIKLAAGTIVDTALLDGRYGLLESDTLYVDGDSLKLGNGTGVPLSVLGADSIDVLFNPDSGVLWVELFSNGVSVGSSFEDLDGRYVRIQDSTDYVTTSKLEDTLSYYTKSSEETYVIELPVAGSLGVSILSATLPDGWSLNTSGLNLLVTHNEGKYAKDISVFYNTSGVQYRMMRNFDNAFSGFVNTSTNDFTIEGLTQFYTLYKVRICISFE